MPFHFLFYVCVGWWLGGGGGQFRAQSVISQKSPIYLDKQYTGPLAGSFENKVFQKGYFW